MNCKCNFENYTCSFYRGEYIIYLVEEEDKMKVMKIISAEYIDGYKISLLFNDDTKKVIDFSELLKNSHYPNEKKIPE